MVHNNHNSNDHTTSLFKPCCLLFSRSCPLPLACAQIICVVGTALVRSTPGLLSVGDVSMAIAPPEPSPSTWNSRGGGGERHHHTHHGVGSGSAGFGAQGWSRTRSPSGSWKPVPAAPALHPPARNPYLRFVTGVASIPAGLVIPHEVSLHVMLKVIADARRGLHTMRQSLLFTLLAQVRLV